MWADLQVRRTRILAVTHREPARSLRADCQERAASERDLVYRAFLYHHLALTQTACRELLFVAVIAIFVLPPTQGHAYISQHAARPVNDLDPQLISAWTEVLVPELINLFWHAD